MLNETDHIPVLKEEVLEQFTYLSKIKKGYFIDGTLGAGGHSIALAKKPGKKINFVGLDLDQSALELAKQNIEKAGLSDQFSLQQGNFKDVKNILDQLGIQSITGALIDLGVSSMQFDHPERGFSFKSPLEPLDMRMDQNQELDARMVLNRYSEAKLAMILQEYGEERCAKRIAKAIVYFRKKRQIETVGDLLEILKEIIPGKLQHSKIHFATHTFQALRIEVNGELTGLDQAVNDITDKLITNGRLAIITFHSLEDRIIKNAFHKLQNPCQCPSEMPCICGKKPIAKIITKKPIIPSPEEILSNPRSRSGKLRVIEKI